jgi:uncharacterized membrane protein YeaQ/YmgE (transglycosylase-associated protein family)
VKQALWAGRSAFAQAEAAGNRPDCAWDRLTTRQERIVILSEIDEWANGGAGKIPAFQLRWRRPRDTVATYNGEDVMIESLIIWLIIGAIAGWLAGQIVKGYGLGLVGNIVVGIVGAFIAGWLLPMIGFVLVGGVLAAIINAVIGAVILLVVIGFFKK